MSGFANHSRTVLLHLAFAHLSPHEEAKPEYAQTIHTLRKPELYGAFIRALPVTREVTTLAELRAANNDPTVEIIWIIAESNLQIADLELACATSGQIKSIITHSQEALVC